MEEKLCESLLLAVESYGRKLQNFANLLSPIMDVAEKIQNELGDINLKFGKLGAMGLYSAQLCVNATTRDFHTEFDQGPTLTSVPNQNLEDGPRYIFLFYINTTATLQLPMTAKMSFIFSAGLLTHRQENDSDSNQLFINLASFCNKKLYHHMKKTFKRVLDSKQK